MKIFYLDKSCWLFLLIIVFCGLFNNFVIYFSLLIIHELGHTFMGITLGYKVDKIKIYPYGGVTTFKCTYNDPLFKEFLVLIMGPIFQIIGYLILKRFINYDYLIIYHYTLLTFNLLPIYPLDGGKLLNILFNYHFNYKLSFYLSFYFSLILIVFFIGYNFYNFNLNFMMILIVLLIKLIKMYKDFDYTYNNFLLERYLYNYKFKKINCIDSSNKFYRDREHIIKMMREKNFLVKYFEKD